MAITKLTQILTDGEIMKAGGKRLLKENVPPNPSKRRRLNTDDYEVVDRTSGNGVFTELRARSSPKKRKSSYVTNFDRKRAEDLKGVYMPSEYVETLMEGFEEEHVDTRLADYFEGVQTNLKPSMRGILCGWLTEVAEHFQLKDITLWQAYQFIDRYLAHNDIHRNNFQLLGSTALWVASKFNERHPPSSSHFVAMSAGAFTKKELLRNEEVLCEKLGYEFLEKTPFQYLERYTDIALHGLSPEAHKELEMHLENNPMAADVTPLVKKAKRLKFLPRYILERYNLTTDSVGRPVKHMAAMALYTALMLTSNDWTKALVKATGFTEKELLQKDFIGGSFRKVKNVVMAFKSEKHKAVIRKYRQPELGAVSTLRKSRQS